MKKCIIIGLVIILVLLNSSIVYASVIITNLYTLDIQNVNDECNIYLLIKKDKLENTINYTKDSVNNYFNKIIKRINKNEVNIEEEYKNNNLPKQLNNTNQMVTVGEKDYIKIKVVKDVIIAWTEMKEDDDDADILIANITDNKVNIIDTSDISIESNDESNIVNFRNCYITRKAMSYDVAEKNLTDITQVTVNKEIKRIEKREKISKILDEISYKLLIFIFITPAIIAGSITEIIVRKIKERKK